MNPVLYLFGSGIFLIMAFVSLPARLQLVIPMALLLVSVFLNALSANMRFLSQVAGAANAIGILFVYSQLIRRLFSREVCQLRLPLVRWAIALLGVLMAVITIHNLLDLNSLFDANIELINIVTPWGVFMSGAIILYCICNAFEIQQNHFDGNTINALVFASSFVLFCFQVSIAMGFIEGNTAKLSEGIGGTGLFMLSTNETGLLGVSLLIWCLVVALNQPAHRLGWTLAAIANVGAVVLTRSRVSLGFLILLGIVFLFTTKPKRWQKSLFLVPILLLVSGAALQIIVERTSAEAVSFSIDESGLSGLPGSGRPVIWFYYLDSFTYLAQLDPLTWLFGVGSLQLIELYQISPLSELGLNLIQADYYPLHSDVLYIFLTAGFVGVVSWTGAVLTLLRIPVRREFAFARYGAFLVYVVFSFVDMFLYFPLGLILLFHVYAQSLDINRLGSQSKYDAAINSTEVSP